MEVALREYFVRNGLAEIFTEIMGLESHRSKIDKFKMLLSKHGLQDTECVFVTDTLGDILEANKVGLRTIAVDFGFHDRERLAQGRPWKIISDFRELFDSLAEIN
jgi:phosphoglycolate phosphatase-like HAD superfamily hydrolase